MNGYALFGALWIGTATMCNSTVTRFEPVRNFDAIWLGYVKAHELGLAASNHREVTLTVLVYDYSRLPASELEDAVAVAQEIFRNAGIATEWLNCAHSHESGHGSGCHEALAASPVAVRIVSRDWQGGRRERIGTALLDAKGRFGVTAYVFQYGVEQALQLGRGDRSRILGHVMAHEVGHLLLGTDSHSVTGIMQSYWAGSQMAKVPGGVTFTPDQARKIRVNIKDRLSNKKRSGRSERVGFPRSQN